MYEKEREALIQRIKDMELALIESNEKFSKGEAENLRLEKELALMKAKLEKLHLVIADF